MWPPISQRSNKPDWAACGAGHQSGPAGDRLEDPWRDLAHADLSIRVAEKILTEKMNTAEQEKKALEILGELEKKL